MRGIVNAHSNLNELTPIELATRPKTTSDLTADWKRIDQDAFFKLNGKMLEPVRPDVALDFPVGLVTVEMIRPAEAIDVSGLGV